MTHPVRLRLSRAKGLVIPPPERLAELREAFLYESSTGILRWRVVRPRGQASIGDIAGSPDPFGYLIVTFARKHYRAHHLAWFFATGNWPISGIDHIDGNTGNNAIGNLRLASHHQNGLNRRTPKNNTSGVKGVYWNKSKQKWQAQITIAGKVTSLGRFYTIEEAGTAVRNARARFHGEFARHD